MCGVMPCLEFLDLLDQVVTLVLQRGPVPPLLQTIRPRLTTTHQHPTNMCILSPNLHSRGEVKLSRLYPKLTSININTLACPFTNGC